MGGYYSSAVGSVFHLYSCRWVAVLDAELESSLSGALIDGDVVGTLMIDGCILQKTANNSLGIYTDLYDTFLIVRNCVFYDIDDCIKLNCTGSRLIQYNNIFVLHTAASGKIINQLNGAINYSDYSCAWAIDGTPSASDRWGGGGKPENTIEENPQFVDAANGNFRPRNSNVLRGGRRDIAGNAAEMGAVLQKYRFDRRAKAVNFGRLQVIR